MSKMLEAALDYLDRGWSILPVKPRDKRPLVSWEEFQKRYPTKEEVEEWFQKWPAANVGIITGKLSNLSVIDVDDEVGARLMDEEILSDTWLSPKASTPGGGYHLYCNYCNGVGNNTRAVPGIDLRSEGGFVAAPPSIGSNGKAYQWIVNPDQVVLSDLPKKYIDRVEGGIREGLNTNTNFLNKYVVGEDKDNDGNKCPQIPTRGNIKRVLSFNEPGRDETLFHVANSLYRSGMPEENVRQVIERLALSCNPPFPERELEIKIKSVLQRAEKRQRPIAEELREFVGWQQVGTIRLQDAYTHLQVVTREEKKAVQMAFKRMDGILVEKIGSMVGTYRILNQELKRLDFKDKSDLTGELFIKFPLNIHEFIKVMPKCIYIIAGEPDSGKSGYLMNFAKKNSEKHKVHYFSSEMGKSEFLDRLQYFWTQVENNPNMNFYERSEDFDQVIFPDDINIIDYMTLYDNFYLMAGLINAIGKKLRGGIAFIALQKPPGRDAALGGDRTKDLARLYLALSYQQMKIIKAKNWRNPKFNPNRLTINYEIWEGWDFKNTTAWQKEV